MSSWAKPGVKCVYIGKEHTARKIQRLVMNRVYTIREIVIHPDRLIAGCYLVEVINPYHTFYNMEMGYNLKSFRPLISQQDDIAMFKALLAPTPDLVPIEG